MNLGRRPLSILVHLLRGIRQRSIEPFLFLRDYLLRYGIKLLLPWLFLCIHPPKHPSFGMFGSSTGVRSHSSASTQGDAGGRCRQE
jgi:hypothetical protein